MKKFKHLFMALLVVASVLCVSTLHSEAASKKPTMSLDDTYLLNKTVSYGSYIGGVDQDSYKIASVVSSNPKVASYDKQYSNEKAFYLKLKRAGKTDITVKVKVGKKTYTLSKTIEVVDDKPFKNIKYGGKDLYKGNEYTSPYVKGSNSKKLTWELKKGYKLIRATYYDGMGKSKTVRQNCKFNFKKVCYPSVDFFIQTPNGQYITYAFHFNNN